MLERLKNAAVCALFGAYLLIFGCAVWVSSHQPIRDKIGAGRYYQIETNEISSPYKWKWGKSDPGVALFTFLLCCIAAAQAGLFIIQLRYMNKGLRDATIAAYAARDSADAQRSEFLATHRPRVRIKHLWLANEIWGGQPIRVNLGIVNYGTKEGTLNSTGIRFIVIPKDHPIPFDPHFPDIPGLNIAGWRLIVGVWLTIPDIPGPPLAQQQIIDIQNRRANLFCLGYVSYWDGANNMRITGYCRMLQLPKASTAPLAIENCRFRPFDDPDYEYEN